MNTITIKIFSKQLKFSMLWVLILMVILNVFTKSLYLSQESIYGDEGYSIFHAQKSLGELKDIFLNDQNPPLHIALLHFWMKIFGVSDVSAKGFSVVASVLCAILLFLFSEKFLNRRTTIIVSLLFLLSNVQLFYSHEVRTYALVQLLCVASFYFYFKLIKEPNKIALATLSLINLLLIFSHYLTIFIFITQFICIWMYYKSNRKGIIYYLISQIIVVVCFFPWLNVLFSNLPKNGTFWLTAPAWGELKWFVLMMNGNEYLFFIFSIIILLSLILIPLNKRFNLLNKEFDIKIYFVFLALYILPIALDYWVAQYTPVFLGRYFLYCTIGLFLAIAYLISCLNVNVTFRAVIIAPVLYCLIVAFDAKPEKEDDWKSIIPKVQKSVTAKTAIFVSASYKYKEFAFYYDREAFKDYKNTLPRLYNEHVYCAKEGEWGWDNINLDSIEQIIFVQSHSKFEDPEGKIKQSILASHFKACSEFSKINITVTNYKKENLACLIVKPIHIKKAIGCDLWDTTIGITEQTNDSIMIYNTGMEIDSNCAVSGSISKEKVMEGNFSCKINFEQPYSVGIIKTLSELWNIKKVDVLAFVNNVKGSDSRLVVSVEIESQSLFRQEWILNETIKNSDTWVEINLSAVLPDNLPPDAVFKVYFWNPSEKPSFVDDMTVQLN